MCDGSDGAKLAEPRGADVEVDVVCSGLGFCWHLLNVVFPKKLPVLHACARSAVHFIFIFISFAFAFPFSYHFISLYCTSPHLILTSPHLTSPHSRASLVRELKKVRVQLHGVFVAEACARAPGRSHFFLRTWRHCAYESLGGARRSPHPNPKGQNAPTTGKSHMHLHTTCLSPTNLSEG